jgi:hypothetical protein
MRAIELPCYAVQPNCADYLFSGFINLRVAENSEISANENSLCTRTLEAG